MKAVFFPTSVLVFVLSFLASCAFSDDIEDISVEARPPNGILVVNNCRVSPLKYISLEISRSGSVIHTFEKDCSIPAGDSKVLTLDDFTIMQEDTIRVKDAYLSWSM